MHQFAIAIEKIERRNSNVAYSFNGFYFFLEFVLLDKAPNSTLCFFKTAIN